MHISQLKYLASWYRFCCILPNLWISSFSTNGYSIYRSSYINCWLDKFLPSASSSFKSVFRFIFNSSAFEFKLLLLNVTRFWHLPLAFGLLSCTFNISALLLKWHHAEFDIDEQCLILFFPIFWKSSSLVIYSVKTCDLFRWQTLD